MSDKLIEKGWLSFRAAVIDAHAEQHQIESMRLAFYGGATILFESLLRDMDEGEEPTDADMQRIADVQDELTAFADSCLPEGSSTTIN